MLENPSATFQMTLEPQSSPARHEAHSNCYHLVLTFEALRAEGSFPPSDFLSLKKILQKESLSLFSEMVKFFFARECSTQKNICSFMKKEPHEAF